MPTDEEEAAIQRGIAADPDTVEWTDEEFAQARPAKEMMAPGVYDALVANSKRHRGKQVAPVKQQIALRLDPDVLARWRESGPGWQSRMGEALRAAAPVTVPATVRRHRPVTVPVIVRKPRKG